MVCFGTGFYSTCSFYRSSNFSGRTLAKRYNLSISSNYYSMDICNNTIYSSTFVIFQKAEGNYWGWNDHCLVYLRCFSLD